MPRILICLLICAILLAPLPPLASAQTCSSVSWTETNTRAFLITYPQGNALGPEIANLDRGLLDTEYNRFATLFSLSLHTPITIRLYPTGSQFTCLNATVPSIPIGQTHSHIGGREISLIAEYISRTPDWQTTGINDLRHELAILFAYELTGGKTPPGLEIGLGMYAENPAQTFERHVSSTSPPTAEPSLSWRGVWEAPNLITDPSLSLQAASIVAYLVDVYGWDRFVGFLSTLRTAESYRAALTEVYRVEASALEEQWLTYYPLYFEGRWRDNALYEFNLSAYEQLIAAGAYQAATDGLASTIALLTQRGDQPELLTQAQSLLTQAANGLEADALARQAHQAYQEDNYPTAADFAVQALEKYTPLNDVRNQETLLTIQDRAEEILSLRAELDDLQTTLTPSDASRLLEIAPRLSELGDTLGQTQAGTLLSQINEQRQQQAITFAMIGAGTGLLLLMIRIALTRRRTPQEVLVQY